MKADETEKISTRLKAAIDGSPVLSAFGVQVRNLRGRFYLEWRWDPVGQPEQTSSSDFLIPALENSVGRIWRETVSAGAIFIINEL